LASWHTASTLLGVTLISSDEFVTRVSGEKCLIGAGGWAYFRVPGERSIKAYARAFNFVAVNSTFYRLPSLRKAREWRRSVPHSFAFSIKAPASITHEHGLRPTPEVFESLKQAIDVCEALGAKSLVFETPQSLMFRAQEEEGLELIVAALSERGIAMCLEARAYRGRDLPSSLAKLMSRKGIIDVVDLSVQTPRVASSEMYTRLLGPDARNSHEFSNDELRDIDRKALEGDYERMIFTFHGVRMYRDAARFAHFKRTGSFPG